MASSPNTLSTINSMFKYVQDKSQSLLPENAVLLRLVPEITNSTREGRTYLQSVQLSHENGITFGNGDVFSLNDASAAAYDEIDIVSYPQVLLTEISESVAGRMANSKLTFITEASLRAEVMYNSLARFYEIAMLYGKAATGIGTSKTTSTAAGTTGTCLLSDGQWSDGIWAGATNMRINFYASGGALVSSGADSIFTVTSVDAATKSFNFSGTATGITALSTAFGAGVCTIVINGAGGSSAVNGNIMFGLDAQIVGGQTFFGINPATYSLWQGQTYAAGGAACTMQKALALAAKCVGMGGLNSEAIFQVSAATYQNLNADQAALRQYDSSYSGTNAQNGTEEITYRGPNGRLSVVVNNVVKEGEAHLFPKRYVKRVGVHEMSFKRPGQNDEFFQEIPMKAGYYLRASGDFAVLLAKPAQGGKMTGIVNS